ncbi:hypothetical protein AB833_05710 [Chromatiales bacterium (ex Bugula neritina AB1)]|nr:hypothetical protein AB833_05710 [Chromatiales bacterium (ex Bugula neritina AB1)]
MPAAYYRSEEFLQLELEQLFRRQWICLARQEEIGKPGDFVVRDLAGESVLLVRQDNGSIHALSNVCLHRGTLIAEGSGNTRRFVCPYHAWTYSTAGELLRMPLVERSECRNLRLPEFRCEIWGGFVYVNLDQNAASLSPQLEGLSALTRNYHMEEMTLSYSAEQVWPVNWKCLAENFMEGYHLSHVHQETLHPVTPTHLCEHFAPGLAYLGYNSRYPATYVQRGKGHHDLSDAEKQVSPMFAVMPAHVAGVAAHATSYLLLQPQGVDAVRAQLGVAVYDDSISEQKKEEIGMFFEKVMNEDKEQMTRLYTGLASRFYEPRVLASAPHEGTVLDFYHYMDRVFNVETFDS